MSILASPDVHLIDYLRVIYKRRVFFALVLLVAVGGAAWSTHRQQPLFQSTAKLLLENDATLIDFPGLERRPVLRVDTELYLMTGREVAEYAVRTFLRPGLEQGSPEFEVLVRQLMGRTRVDLVRNTLIVDMKSLAYDPEQARRYCDAMAESYVAVNFLTKKDANAVAAAAINDEIDDTQRSLEAAERRLMDFKAEYNLVSDRAKADEQAHVYSAGTSARVEASLQKTEVEYKYRMLKSWYSKNDFTLPLPTDIAPNSIVNDLYAQIVKKRIELKAMLVRYREQHPKVEAANSELETLKRTFDFEVQNSLEILRKRAEIFAGVSDAHEGRMVADRRDFLKENERDWQYNVLQRDVEAKEEVFRSLLKKKGELNVLSSISRNNARFLQRAESNPLPVRPNWRFNMMVGLVFGVGVGLAGVFFLEYLDKSLKTPDDIARYLGLPVLAVVPLARAELLRAPYESPQIRDGGAVTA